MIIFRNQFLPTYFCALLRDIAQVITGTLNRIKVLNNLPATL